MKKFRLEVMKRGWFIGNFEPVAFKTKDFEVGYARHKKGDIWDKHYHKKATEITAIIKGKIKINEEIFTEGDIIIIEPNEIADPQFLEDTEFVVIKTISDQDDKFILER